MILFAHIMRYDLVAITSLYARLFALHRLGFTSGKIFSS